MIQADETALPKAGRFGPYGGCYVPEILVGALRKLEDAVRDVLPDPRTGVPLCIAYGLAKESARADQELAATNGAQPLGVES